MSDSEVSSSRIQEPFARGHHQYFLTPELSQRLNLIRHLIQNSEQLLLVLAESGCGKTALLNQLKKIAAQQCEHWWIYTPVSSPALSQESLIAAILTAFNVRQEGKPIQVLQDSLRGHIAATRYNGQLPVLLVDEAHKLPLATLKFIIELAMQGEALTRMRVVLFCEPQITSILATPEFDMVHNTLVHSLDIPHLSKSQVRDYIQFRLQGSQYHNTHPFHSEVIKKIYAESEGIPSEINLAAQQVLHHFLEQTPSQFLRGSLSSPKLIWGVAVVIILFSIALLFHWKYPELLEENYLLPSIEQTTTPVFPHNETTNHPVRSAGSVGFSEEENELVSPQVDSILSKQTLPSQESIISPEMTTISEPVDETQIKGEDWLRRQNPNAYTLQILGAHDQLTLKNFLSQYHLPNMATFKTTYRHKDWYVLVYGIYSNRNQAIENIKNLPQVLQQNTQPWVRSLASIQALINQ